jgi:hypothetical protein
MTKLSFILIVCLGFTINLKSQILVIDRENGQDSMPRKQLFAWNVSFSSDKQKKSLLEFSNSAEYDRFFKNDQVLITLLNTDASFNGKTILENNGYFQMRLRNNDKKRVAPDYFIQYQWNGIWGLQNRALAGCNARFKFWDDKTDDLFMSIGAFYEYEKWNPNLSSYAFGGNSQEIVFRYIPRLNLSAKTAVQLAKGVDLSAITFLQFPMNEAFTHFSQPRWFLDLNLNFDVNKHISLILHYDQNIDYYRPLPIDIYFYNLNLGFQLKW